MSNNLIINEIPEGAELIQTGLYVYRYTKTIGNRVYTFGQLYASEGYCFYENSLPEEERIYMQFQTLTLNEAAMTNEQVSALVTCVPIEDWMEIVSIPTNPPVTE